MSKPFRGINGSDDWSFGQGRNSYFTKQQAIAADIKTKLLFFLNDCFWAMDFGVDWWNLLGTKNPQAKVGILLATRSTIISCAGVVRINSVTTKLDAQRRLTLLYNVDTIYSRSVSGAVQIP